jgi:hypothetical protein
VDHEESELYSSFAARILRAAGHFVFVLDQCAVLSGLVALDGLVHVADGI